MQRAYWQRLRHTRRRQVRPQVAHAPVAIRRYGAAVTDLGVTTMPVIDVVV
jgi:hypothetical protein